MGSFSADVILFGFISHPAAPKEKKTVVRPVSAEETDRSVATITGSGTIVTLAHSSSANVSRQVEQELTRTYDVVRVKNPDDPSQHVDVEAITAMAIRAAQNVVKDLKFERPQASENVQVIEQNKTRIATGNYGKVVRP